MDYLRMLTLTKRWASSHKGGKLRFVGSKSVIHLYLRLKVASMFVN